ncbi:MAG: DUF4446 family protein [Jatrophihabitantaceae bacterium]
MNNWLAIAAVCFGLAGFGTGTLALRTLGKLRRSVALLSRGKSGRETIGELADKHMAASEAVRKDILELQQDLTTAVAVMRAEFGTERAQVAEAVQSVTRSVSSVLSRVALVRYDAFDDLGGRLSFSLAILDEQGSGILLTSIAGSSDTRLYAKSMTRGVAEHSLSPEEEQAAKAAMTR